MGRRGMTLVELLGVMLILAIVVAIALPNLLQAVRAAREKSASFSLRILVRSEMDFRVRDPDQNGAADFWTADVAGMFYVSPTSTRRIEITAGASPFAAHSTANGGITSGSTGPNADLPVDYVGERLIEYSIALADADTGSEKEPYSPGHVALPRTGYWYIALTNVQTGSSSSAEGADYRVRNPDGFGIAAVPYRYGEDGRIVMIVNQQGVVWQRDPDSETALWAVRPIPGSVNPEGNLTEAFNTFPLNPSVGKNLPPTVSGPWTEVE